MTSTPSATAWSIAATVSVVKQLLVPAPVSQQALYIAMRAGGAMPLMLPKTAAGPVAAAPAVERYHSRDFAFWATAPGNPFDVELAGEFTGPDGARLAVPSFYDGEGLWKTRFSPPPRASGPCA